MLSSQNIFFLPFKEQVQNRTRGLFMREGAHFPQFLPKTWSSSPNLFPYSTMSRHLFCTLNQLRWFFLVLVVKNSSVPLSFLLTSGSLSGPSHFSIMRSYLFWMHIDVKYATKFFWVLENTKDSRVSLSLLQTLKNSSTLYRFETMWKYLFCTQ